MEDKNGWEKKNLQYRYSQMNKWFRENRGTRKIKSNRTKNYPIFLVLVKNRIESKKTE